MCGVQCHACLARRATAAGCTHTFCCIPDLMRFFCDGTLCSCLSYHLQLVEHDCCTHSAMTCCMTRQHYNCLAYYSFFAFWDHLFFGGHRFSLSCNLLVHCVSHCNRTLSDSVDCRHCFNLSCYRCASAQLLPACTSILHLAAFHCWHASPARRPLHA